jgi:hypothetical protein
MKSYMIHDNMTRPFKVVVGKNKIKIYEHRSYDDDDSDFDEYDIKQYDVLVMSIENYIQVFIGEDPDNEDFEGNNILVHTKKINNKNTYIMIDGEIFSFTVDDKIIDFRSPIGNSDVPYSYAVGKKNTYLMTLKQTVPTSIIENNDDPYENKYDKFTQNFSTKILIQRKM